MSALTDWIAVSAGLALFCGLQAVYWLRRGKRLRQEQLLKQQLHGRPVAVDAGGIRIRTRQDDGAAGGTALSRLARRLNAALVQAGVRATLSQVARRTASGALAAWVLAVVLTRSPLLGLFFAAFVVLGVYAYVVRRREQRVKQLGSQLPGALEMMVFSLRAGHGLEEAIRAAAEEVDQPLAGELQRCHEEYSLGRPIEAALQQLRARWPAVRALYSFVEAVVVLKRTGGNLVEVMRTLIDSVRAQEAFESRHRALIAEGRLSGRILMALPLVAAVVQALTSPRQLQAVMENSTGQMLLVSAALLWAIGSLWVNRLAQPVGGRL